MSKPQIISFILLWIIILVEGNLLFLLYRHVGLLYTPKPKGLPIGTKAPVFTAMSSRGMPAPLVSLLSARYNVLIFGSPGCPPCHALLASQAIRELITAQSIPAYFALQTHEAAGSIAALSGDSGTAFEVISVEGNTFIDYAVSATPFAYVIDHAGTIRARGQVSEPQLLIDLWHQAATESQESLIPRLEIPTVNALEGSQR